MTDGGKILRKSMKKLGTFPLLTTAKYNVFYCVILYFVGPSIVHVMVDLSVCDAFGRVTAL
jgi:hypothetical protein